MAKTKKAPKVEDENSHARMTFGDHLEELRRRIIYSLLGSIFGVVLCLTYVNQIVELIVRPYRLALLTNGQPDVFTYSKPAEVVILYLTLGIQAGLVLSSPWIIHQIWSFVAAGLYLRERKVVYRYVGPSALLFLMGVAFFYFIVLPLTLSFFVRFTAHAAGPPPTPNAIEKLFHLDPSHGATSQPAFTATQPMVVPALAKDPDPPPAGQVYLYYHDGKVSVRTGSQIITLLYVAQGSLFTNLPSLDDYLKFVMITALIFGLAFELPMVIMILAQIGIVEPQTFRNVRKYAYFILAVLSAVAAPSPDPTMMLALMLPLALLYELGIILGAIVVRRQEKRAAES